MVAYIKYLENKGIYFPEKKIEFYPSFFNLSFQDIYLKTEDDVTINAWFIPYPQAKYTLLFFHGNAGNLSHRLEKLMLLRKAGVNIFIIDYRGYGKSEGVVTEKGFYFDASATYHYLVNHRGILAGEIILYGESLGTAVAINLAAKTKVRAIILEGAFSRGRDMARKIFPFLPTLIFSNSFDSLKKIQKVRVPKLFIHSRNDEVVPFELANKLYHASLAPKEFAEIEGCHNSAFLDSKEKYFSSIDLFIKKLK